MRIKTERRADGALQALQRYSVTVLQLQLGLCDKNGAERKKGNVYIIYILLYIYIIILLLSLFSFFRRLAFYPFG